MRNCCVSAPTSSLCRSNQNKSGPNVFLRQGIPEPGYLCCIGLYFISPGTKSTENKIQCWLPWLKIECLWWLERCLGADLFTGGCICIPPLIHVSLNPNVLESSTYRHWRPGTRSCVCLHRLAQSSVLQSSKYIRGLGRMQKANSMGPTFIAPWLFGLTQSSQCRAG